MSTILFAWELGENWGHLSRDLPVARRLLSLGDRVTFAVADTRIAADILGPSGIPFVQAPIPRRKEQRHNILVSHAEIAMINGYSNHSDLRGLIGGWLALIDLIRPDVIVLNYSPTARLAAHIRGIPTVLTANGFEFPPLVSPMPTFRTWEAVPEDRLRVADQTALQNINHVLNEYGTAPLTQFADLFQTECRIMTTFAELDHFGERANENYIGHVFELFQMRQVSWHSKTSGKRIFAYLRPWVHGIEELLITLRRSGADVICVIPGAPPSLVKCHHMPRLRIFTEAVALEPLLSCADLVIGYGSGMLTTTLLAGIPLLLVPVWAEQYLSALCVETLGAGLIAKDKPSQLSYFALIERLLSEPKYRSAALLFAEKYTDFNIEHATDLIVDAVQNIVK